jgi:hypothetical protein
MHAYACLGCQKAKKALKSDFKIESIHVTGHHFMKDPEDRHHLCVNNEGYLFPYEELEVTRIYRSVLNKI